MVPAQSAPLDTGITYSGRAMALRGVAGAHLGRGVELEEAAAEGGAGGVVLELEEHGHGQLQAEHVVDGLQVAVREVGGQLCSAGGVRSHLLALELAAQGDVVLLADVEQLLGLRQMVQAAQGQVIECRWLYRGEVQGAGVEVP